MSRTNAERSAIRLKFMPTPNIGLHVGHAWLLFVMQAIKESIKQQGYTVEIVLVIDDINMIYMKRALEGINEVAEEIVRNMEQLGAPPDHIVWNGKVSLEDAQLESRLQSIALDTWQPARGLSADYFFRNAALDEHLGITHIIRGKDLKAHKDIYEECYAKLGADAPVLDYIPFVRQYNGKKIGSHHHEYTLNQVLANISAEELLCALVWQCIRLDRDYDPPLDRATAMQLLLGNDSLLTTFCSQNANERERFFSRFSDFPQFGSNSPSFINMFSARQR